MTENITTLEGLKKAISVLEFEKAARGVQLETQFYLLFEGLKPINILKKTIKGVATSPNLIENVVGATLGIATGYVSKKIVVRGSANIFRKFFGTMLQFGVANLVASQSHALKHIGQFAYNRFFEPKNVTTDTL